MSNKSVILRIRRQAEPYSQPYWEEFEVPYSPQMNVITCLMLIQRNPVTRDGRKTSAPSWDMSCLEEVCGACTMVINGRPRQSCSALVDTLEQPITLEPMSKFPIVKDLVVDRGKLFKDLMKVNAWIDLDGTHAMGAGPRYSQELQELRYDLSRCMSCGCCLEVCPQYDSSKAFVGAAVISQVRLFNLHPTGSLSSNKRLEMLAQPGGITDCGNAQNCVRACPKEIKLTESIAEMGRQMFFYGLRKFFGGKPH